MCNSLATDRWKVQTDAGHLHICNLLVLTVCDTRLEVDISSFHTVKQLETSNIKYYFS